MEFNYIILLLFFNQIQTIVKDNKLLHLKLN